MGKSGDDVGLKVAGRNGKIWVVGVRQDGLFGKYVPIRPGDQILSVNGQQTINTPRYNIPTDNDSANSDSDNDINDGLDADEVDRIFKHEKDIELKVRRTREEEYGDDD